MMKKLIWVMAIVGILNWGLTITGCISDASAGPAGNYTVKTIYHSGHTFLVYESSAGVGVALIP